MKLYYYQNKSTSINFGDTLNAWLWPKILGNFLDDNDSELFVGFGTMLNERLPKHKQLNIFSTGYGYATEKIEPQNNWRIHCVRGPLTADALGLESKYAVADGAILAEEYVSRSNYPQFKYGYMPHFVNANQRWKNISEDIGVKFIDPTQSVDVTLRELSEIEILLTEAMHGAIIADSLGIPWIPIKSSKIINTFKWEDYCQSMGIQYQPCQLPPMSATVKPTVIGRLRSTVKYKWVRSELDKIIRKEIPTITPRIKMVERKLQLKERLEILVNDRA